MIFEDIENNESKEREDVPSSFFFFANLTDFFLMPFVTNFFTLSVRAHLVDKGMNVNHERRISIDFFAKDYQRMKEKQFHNIPRRFC
jgi:hypothetical protein